MKQFLSIYIWFLIFMTSLAMLVSSARAKDKHDEDTLRNLDCSIHRIYCRITELQPNIDLNFAFHLSNLIFQEARKYNKDPMISVAIAMQESSLNNINRVEWVSDDKGNIIRGYSDIGIFQIHAMTAKEFNLDANRLMHDVQYQVQSHFKILKRKVSVCSQKRERLKVEPGTEWSCYHSYTPEIRKRYKKLVERYIR